MAAVLASGPCAVLSHRSAASLWRIRATTRSLIEVTASRQCSRPGIQTHRGSVPADEMTVLRGIPVTTASDAHLPEDVGRDLDQAVALAREAGYETVTVFEERKARQEPLG